MTRIARAFGQALPAVLAWPWHDVLLAEFGLDEVERIEGLAHDVAELHDAFLVHYAVLKPSQLQVEQRALQARLRAGDRPESVDEDALAASAAALAEHFRRNRGEVS